MLSKGFIAGIQFEALFTDGLFYDIGKHENSMAYLLSDGLEKLGIKLYCPTITNQIFLYIDKKHINTLKEKIRFEIWEEQDESFVIRFVTGYTTTIDTVNEALAVLKDVISE